MYLYYICWIIVNICLYVFCEISITNVWYWLINVILFIGSFLISEA